MLVRDISKENLHLTKVVFDDESECLIDNDIVSDNSISIGCNIDSNLLEQIKYDSNYKRAKSRALWYLERMEYTKKGMYQKLIKAGFEKEACMALIDRLSEVELIDDRRYAENYASRCVESNISRRESISKMINKGVPYDLASEVMDGFDTDEEEQVKAVIIKKYQNKLSTENGTQKVFAALIRKGFSYSSVRNALKNFSEELEYSEEY